LVRAVREYGLKGTLRRLYQFKDIKFGTLIGEDELGNKYFENLELPSGQHRWVEPAVFDTNSLIEASLVSPRWHGWLHYTTDAVPCPPDQVPERTGFPLADKVHNPVSTHTMLEHRRPWRQNPTNVRERGHKVDTHFAKAGENDFYVQPGHMQHPNRKEVGHRIESWSAEPVARKSPVALEKEPWEKFYEQRKKMNATQEAKK